MNQNKRAQLQNNKEKYLKEKGEQNYGKQNKRN